MKVNYYWDETVRENRVDIYCRVRDREMDNLIEFLKEDFCLYGKEGGAMRQIYLNEIYYVEVVERRCFAYLEQAVYELNCSLKVFLEQYEERGFWQIGKSTVVNVKRIEKIVPDINMRMHLVMENGEKLICNRAFKKDFMKRLKEKKEDLHENH